ncbi:DeoR/GlpR transcriptional regulator [Brevibacillus fluminis]|uniref:DeoR/GlpR transcriptional regulator n=1 Tax=Brevibacillus fluminis TaxID=511487 RepID=A0A3M8DU63_9BACL|nr:DeoR/GlpR family DNA-binding transcription regulator [Brevibacillus fluminis]RNB91733.1 DeoR/GlpR transcriptional regulator [Brevibacillus fluminis]
MSLIGEERKEIILNILNFAGKVRTNELVEKLQVSSETIRRYLEELEGEQRLKRVYGGAIKINYDREEPSHLKREVLYAEEKQLIGQAASLLVQNNDVIVIDDGTTTQQIIPYLIHKQNVTILTGSFPALSLLMDYQNKGLLTGELYFIGGKVQPKHLRTSGALSVNMIENFHIDKAFLSIDGISMRQGITSYDVEKALVVKTYIDNAKTSIVMTDQSKIGLGTFYKICDLKEIDIIISGVCAPKDWKQELEDRDINWIVAQ